MPDSRKLELVNAPIIEAIVEIQCDLPPNINRSAFHSSAQRAFADQYPEFRTSLIHEQHFAIQLGKQQKEAARQPEPRQVVRGYQSLSRDKKQIVQSRFDGFSFNRLAPYSSLDDYLIEIKRCWEIYCSFSQPVVVRKVALRYINRLRLPLDGNKVFLGNYIVGGPILPPGTPLTLTSFLHHHNFVDEVTRDSGHIIIAAQPVEDGVLPVILDIEASRVVQLPAGNWDIFVPIIAKLRSLKNDLFMHTLTPKCLSLFQ